MSTFKPRAEIRVVDSDVEGLLRIEGVSGGLLFVAQFASREDAERVVICWNACRSIAFPPAHINGLQDRVERLEKLRRDAWERAQELEAELAQLRSKAVKEAAE